jgi:gas vesicle protein
MTSTAKVILGIIGAATAGVVIGMLVAPEKGSELRTRIKRTAGDWAGQLGDLFASAQEEAAEIKDKAVSAARNVKANADRMKESLG